MTKSTMTVDNDGVKRWRNDEGEYHREDGPAIERICGTTVWFQNGKIHRVDGPAIENSNGSKVWYQNGQRHRLDGPAIEWGDGTSIWYIRGRYLNTDIKGFWALWELLNEDQRQNVNLHMWLRKLTND